MKLYDQFGNLFVKATLDSQFIDQGKTKLRVFDEQLAAVVEVLNFNLKELQIQTGRLDKPADVRLVDENSRPRPVGDVITKDKRTSQFVVSGFTDTDIVHVDVQNISAASTAFMLIDISDTTKWPHTNKGHIIIEYIILEIDPNDSYIGEVKFGFLDRVDATNGDFHQIIDIDMERKADLIVEVIDFGSHGMDLEVDHWFGPTTANSTLFQTDTSLLGPDGTTTFPSGNGDFVMIIEATAGAVDVSMTIGYETAD